MLILMRNFTDASFPIRLIHLHFKPGIEHICGSIEINSYSPTDVCIIGLEFRTEPVSIKLPTEQAK